MMRHGIPRVGRKAGQPRALRGNGIAVHEQDRLSKPAAYFAKATKASAPSAGTPEARQTGPTPFLALGPFSPWNFRRESAPGKLPPLVERGHSAPRGLVMTEEGRLEATIDGEILTGFAVCSI
jgi:hypothetical protein